MKSIIEARRQLATAKEILKEKAGKEDGYYLNKKYVKMAGLAAYKSVLFSLDDVLGNKKRSPRKSAEWYQNQLSNIDRKITRSFDDVHQILYIALGYDGAGNSKIAAIGLKEAEKIINWVEKHNQISK
ncbi:DUF5618 family protein [Dyadobacter sp. 3J3]|uniref:DUF5618 family protein n=1 Tax=Dyadobacter sp. 3J3 TaxID=2606600 RepID=UPI00135A33BC|nr:DUF5618 family protein [Dyadobacter sp. 3J3]